MGEETSEKVSDKRPQSPLTTEELSSLRQKAKEAFQVLDTQVSQLSVDPPVWIQSNSDTTATGDSATDPSRPQSKDAKFFNEFGFVKKSHFSSLSECQNMKDAMIQLVEENWFPERDGLDSFGTNTAENKARGDYFLDSADRIHYFAEPACVDPQNPTQLQVAFTKHPKFSVLNKAGHAMHCQPGNPFYEYCCSDKILHLVVDELHWQDPVVPQSMYIFKNPSVGGMVHAHQDSTFLFTTPKQSCLGLWLALDDATLENGCLWVRPGSHKEPVKRQYMRNPKHFHKSDTNSEQQSNSSNEPKFLMKPLIPENDSSNKLGNTDGRDDWTADELFALGYIPVECRAGDLLVFCGTLDHLSLPNYSPHQRHTFQLHLVEGPKAGVTWSPHNWLQYPQNKKFLNLRDERERKKES